MYYELNLNIYGASLALAVVHLGTPARQLFILHDFEEWHVMCTVQRAVHQMNPVKD